jgi:hypothetical protein
MMPRGWVNTCEAAGLWVATAKKPTKLFHDLRRTGVGNFSKVKEAEKTRAEQRPPEVWHTTGSQSPKRGDSVKSRMGVKPFKIWCGRKDLNLHALAGTGT